jgi:hypothetical protein
MTPPDTHPLLTLATAQMQALLELKRRLVLKGEPMTPRNMKAELYRVLVEHETAKVQQAETEKPKVKSKRAPAFASMTDEEFITHLEAKPHLKGIDVRREIGKCQLYFEGKRIVPTRARIAEWMNRADPALGFNGVGQTSFAPKKQDAISEPAGWREWVRENATDPTNAEKSWAELGRTAQGYILEQMQRKPEYAQ